MWSSLIYLIMDRGVATGVLEIVTPSILLNSERIRANIQKISYKKMYRIKSTLFTAKYTAKYKNKY